MNKFIIIAIVLVLVILISLFTLSLCKAASDADDREKYILKDTEEIE